MVQNKFEEVTSSEAETSTAEDINYNSSIKNFLAGHDGTTEDKIATVKTAQKVDKGRFEIAFKTLMKR